MSKEVASDDAQGFKMPHVFIVPPEEDETPTWCCFDAALPIDKQIQRRADFDADEHTFDPSSPYDDDIAAMDAAIARRNMETRSIVDTLMSKDFNIEHAGIDSDSDLDWDSDNEYQSNNRHNTSQPPSPNRSLSDVGNDSEIIEVMKVGRRKRYTFDGDDEQTGPRHPIATQRSGTFKSRATKALRSFTGTLSLRSSKSRSNDILPPRSATSMSCQLPQDDDDEAEGKQSTLPRGSRVTRRLSQFFSPPSRSQPSLALVGSTSGQSSALTSPSQPILASQSISSNHSESYDFGPRRSTDARPAEARSTSPITSSTSINKTFKRFAKRNLHRMFSFSSSSHPPNRDSNRDHHDAEPMTTATDSGRATPTLQRKPSPSTSTSSESSGPQTPTTITEEAAPARTRMTRRGTVSSDEDSRNVGQDLETPGPSIAVPSESVQSIVAGSYASSFSSQSKISDSTSASTILSKASSQMSPPPLGEEEDEVEDGEEGDLSYELKLDSLHFDDISFDVDRFVAN